MLDSEEQRARLASTAEEGEIALYVHDLSVKVISTLLENRNLTEDHVLIVANRKNLPPEVLEGIARNKRWAESYRVKLALAKNPKTPLFTALSIARFLRLFDLAELARAHTLPVIYRRKLEALVIEKIPTIALGVKKTLGKVAAGEILLSLIKDGYPDVVKVCLGNPHLTEAGLYKVINRKNTAGSIIKAIADHKNWTCRYHIKFALLRNEHTPLVRSVRFVPELKLADLRELFRDPTLPRSVKPYLHQELLERGIDPEKVARSGDEEIFEIGESEMEDSEKAVLQYEQEAAAEEESEKTSGSG